MDLSRLSVPQRISAIAILVVVVSAFLPWVSLFGITKFGIEGDGVITLLLGIAGAIILAITSGVFGAERRPGRASQIILIVLAVLTALVGLVDMSGAAAAGIYLTLFAGIAWVVGAVWAMTTPTDVKEDAGRPDDDA